MAICPVCNDEYPENALEEHKAICRGHWMTAERQRPLPVRPRPTRWALSAQALWDPILKGIKDAADRSVLVA